MALMQFLNTKLCKDLIWYKLECTKLYNFYRETECYRVSIHVDNYEIIIIIIFGLRILPAHDSKMSKKL